MDATKPVIATFKAPLYVAWELTHRCNAACIHCYSDSGRDADCSGDLSVQEGIGLIDQLADAGVIILAFSGGEPLLYPGWRTLVAHAVARGLGVNIGSNGATVTERVADDLERLGVKSVTVSIDSDKPAVHDAFRGSPGLLQKAVRAIQRLVERNIRVVVGFTPTRVNWQDGPSVVALAHELGADAVNLSEFVPAGRGAIDLALSPQQLHGVLRDWIALREHYAGAMEVLWHDCRVGMLVPDEERRKYVGCGAGRLVARIMPDGTVTPCVFLPTAIGSIRDQAFQTMWEKSILLHELRARGSHGGNCGSCEYLQTCGGCRATAFAYSDGDIFAGDPSCWINLGGTLAELVAGEALPV